MEETNEEGRKHLRFMQDFVSDYCKSEDDKKEFWGHFAKHIDFVFKTMGLVVPVFED